MLSDVVTAEPITIRDADRSDFDALAGLQIRSWRDVYRGILSDAYLDDEIEGDLSARWQTLSPSGDDLVLLAERDQIVGFITIWCQPDPFIDNLHVEPGLRSGGIGRQLMQTAARRLLEKRYQRVSLYVAASNHRAADFYRRLGGRFGEVERLHQKNGGAVDAVEVVWTDLATLANETG